MAWKVTEKDKINPQDHCGLGGGAMEVIAYVGSRVVIRARVVGQSRLPDTSGVGRCPVMEAVRAAQEGKGSSARGVVCPRCKVENIDILTEALPVRVEGSPVK